MRQIEASRQTRKGKHLNREERIQIETLWREGFTEKMIGEKLIRPERTIQREIDRGWVLRRTRRYAVEERYSAQRGQTLYENGHSG